MAILKPPKGVLLNRGHRLARGLVGYWLLNEGGGNLAGDLSGNGVTATVTAPWVSDRFGPAVSITASANLVSMPSSRLGSTGSIVLWFNGTGAPYATCRLFTTNLETQYLIRNSADNALVFRLGGNDGVAYTVPDLWGTGPHCIVVCWGPASTYREVYVDGISCGVDATNYTAVAWGSTLYLGNRSAGGRQAGGLYSSCMWYNRALTSAEIQQLDREPFGMVQRQRLELWTPAISGGGAPPTFKPVWAVQRSRTIGAGVI